MMSTTTLMVHLRARWPSIVAVAMLGGAAGCATSGGATQPRTTVRTVPVAPTGAPPQTSTAVAAKDTAVVPTLPTLPAERQPAVSSAPAARIREVSIPPGTSIATAVTQVGMQLGLTVDVDPAVRGTASANLHNVTLADALDQLVTRNGYQYQIRGSVLRVVPVRMETRSFTLDYVALSRVGTMNTVVQRRFSNSAAPQAGSAT